MTESIIETKSKEFAVRIIKFYKWLCDEKHEFELARQILRSGTSIGANIRESQNAQSKRDFIAKRYISLKKAGETAYWLEILQEAEIVKKEQVTELYKTCSELIKMLTASIKTAKQNLKDRE